MIEASMFAAESQLGSLSIERTERRMDSKRTKSEENDEDQRSRDTDQQIGLVTNVPMLVRSQIDPRRAHATECEETSNESSERSYLL